MKLSHWLAGAAGLGVGLLVYGALYESNQLKLERRRLRLPRWPSNRDHYRIAVLADLHIRCSYSAKLAQEAIAMALDEQPDFVVLPGDIIGYWNERVIDLVDESLSPLLLMNGNAIATPGNREYWLGDPEHLRESLSRCGVRLLRNEHWIRDGICWAGVDSANAGVAQPASTVLCAVQEEHPVITVFHEPDFVDSVPSGSALMISGHSHGGQFKFGNWPPMTTRNGKRYREGFFPEASTPLYVSRGVGTAGPPSRFNCKPEVSILELVSLG